MIFHLSSHAASPSTFQPSHQAASSSPLVYSHSCARYARSLRMLIFTFRLHGLIEVTPCGNIAGAMALNRGARPISSLSFCSPPITNLLLLFLFTRRSPFSSSSSSSLFFFSFSFPTLSLCRFFIINLFPLLFSLLTVRPATPVTLHLVSLTGCCFIYLPHATASHRGDRLSSIDISFFFSLFFFFFFSVLVVYVLFIYYIFKKK